MGSRRRSRGHGSFPARKAEVVALLRPSRFGFLTLPRLVPGAWAVPFDSEESFRLYTWARFISPDPRAFLVVAPRERAGLAASLSELRRSRGSPARPVRLWRALRPEGCR